MSFSWQIVATRANEEFRQKDGTIEVSDYSKRFPPAPDPLEQKMLEGQEVSSTENSAMKYKMLKKRLTDKKRDEEIRNNEIILEQSDLN